jgi:hypothetical protein
LLLVLLPRRRLLLLYPPLRERCRRERLERERSAPAEAKLLGREDRGNKGLSVTNMPTPAVAAAADKNETAPTPAAAAASSEGGGAAAAAAEVEEYASAALSARELEWAVNPPELLAEHRRINGGLVRTR